ncbi:MAG: response regulator transcription factor [Bacteroidetes bacterium]|jgi:DNA-binding NarL/FixJ family response regulator|nr:response regulator transcription factor [Bacteroidota bacterium]MBU1580796.1 response regulator transcription factor [Bacteroidota bacterium]MBU2558379.1 response regulator transcription factor [Bacteroidota bacterium]MDA3942179.1 response regulator transcription factor [Bacteroidota bacterium]
MIEKIKLALVDAHPIMRDGISCLLTDAPDIQIVHNTNTVNELIPLLYHEPVHIVMTVLYAPDPADIETIKHLCDKHQRVKVLVLSMYQLENFILKMIRAGAKGHLTSDTDREEIIEAIYTLRNGYDFYAKTITNLILRNYLIEAENKNGNKHEREQKLSTRELEVLKLFAQSHTNKEIAEKLYISVRTVESHKNNIMQKLNLKTMVDMVKFAIRNNLVEL